MAAKWPLAGRGCPAELQTAVTMENLPSPPRQPTACLHAQPRSSSPSACRPQSHTVSQAHGALRRLGPGDGQLVPGRPNRPAAHLVRAGEGTGRKDARELRLPECKGPSGNPGGPHREETHSLERVGVLLSHTPQDRLAPRALSLSPSGQELGTALYPRCPPRSQACPDFTSPTPSRGPGLGSDVGCPVREHGSCRLSAGKRAHHGACPRPSRHASQAGTVRHLCYRAHSAQAGDEPPAVLRPPSKATTDVLRLETTTGRGGSPQPRTPHHSSQMPTSRTS